MLLFIYGTLKRLGSNQHYMQGQRFVDTAVTVPQYRMYDIGGYPGMIADSQDGLSIHGEVWEVSEEALQKLDELEDLDSGEYAREIIPLLPPHDKLSVQGYRYLFPIQAYRDIGHQW